MIIFTSKRPLPVAVVTGFLLLCGPQANESVLAQSSQGIQTERLRSNALASKTSPSVTPKDVESFVAPLSDAEVRLLLLERLKRDAAAHAPTAEQGDSDLLTGVVQTLQARSIALSERFVDLAAAVGDAPSAFEYTLRNLTDNRGLPAVGRALLVLALMIVLGAVAEWLLNRQLGGMRARLIASSATTWSGRLGYLLVCVALDLLSVGVFAVTAYAVSFAFFDRYDPLRLFVTTYLTVIAMVRGVRIFASFLLAPRASGIRLLALGDEDAADFHRWLLVIAAVAAVGFLTSGLLSILGMPEELRLLFIMLVGLAVTALMLALVWRYRARVADAIAGAPVRTIEQGSLRAMLAQAWHLLATAYLTLVWAVWAMNVLLQRFGEAQAALYSLLIVLAVPVADRTVNMILIRIIRARTERASEVQQRAQRLKNVLQSSLRAVLVAIALAALLEAWGIGLMHAFDDPVGRAVLGATFNIAVVLLFAYVVWEIVKIGIDPHLAERGDDEQPIDAEGGGGGSSASRAQTLLPLLRSFIQIVLVVMITMIVLSSLGINIGPLLAGAGVVGLAIGFGAQRLVQDVFSGIFFLIDDAFRVGEYVEAAGMKGTVERISIRSMRLRHHLGTVQTVPFGEVGAVRNHSRDWVIVKLEIRLPYGTDIEKVRKIIKRVGQEMIADEQLGKQMLQPLKSQGVFRVEESALIVRMKFMSVPGEQWIPRREAYRRVKDALEARGIHFAHREVTVRSSPPSDPQSDAAASTVALTTRDRSDSAG